MPDQAFHMFPIASRRNAHFRKFLSLGRTRGIKKHGQTLMAGRKHVAETLERFPEYVTAVIVAEGRANPLEALCGHLPHYVIEQALFKELDPVGAGPPLLVIAVPPLSRPDRLPPVPGCTLCLPFQDPVNVGTALRAAAAFGVSTAVILREAAHPWHPKALRASGPAVFSLSFLDGPSLEEVETLGLPVVTLSPRGRDIRTFSFPERFCLVPGLEGTGLPTALARHTALSIPMEKGVESLNAALATGIALWLWRQRGG